MTFPGSAAIAWRPITGETNASNAGNDYFFQNDGFLGGGDTPGEAVRRISQRRWRAGRIPLSCHSDGWLRLRRQKRRPGRHKTPDFLNVRFLKSLPAKEVHSPSARYHDRAVYQDEFVAWLEKTFPNTHKSVMLSLSTPRPMNPTSWTTPTPARTGQTDLSELTHANHRLHDSD